MHITSSRSFSIVLKVKHGVLWFLGELQHGHIQTKVKGEVLWFLGELRHHGHIQTKTIDKQTPFGEWVIMVRELREITKKDFLEGFCT